VYRAGKTHMHLEDIPAPSGSARKAWVGFGVSVAVVIVAGRFLAASADRIAEISGISASFIGVLLVSIVTTLPEGSVTVAATLRKSYGIAMGNVYGSNAFNVTILFFSDLFSDAPLLGQMQHAHYAAALGAFALMTMGYLVWKGVQNRSFARARALAPAIPLVYLGAVYVVYRLAQG
jgi:cation:H+ antiporter